MTRLRHLLAVLGVAAATTLPGAAPAAAAVDRRPTAVVVLGDSAASGEGAGDYEVGTRGEDGNWCHRSAHAYVHRTRLAATSVNLACSGAAAGDVAFGPGRHHGEGSQAARLVDVAHRHRVTTVLVQVGANDEIAVVDTATACIRAFLVPTGRPCRSTLGPLLPARLAATTGRVEAAVRDVREAMRRAGYGEHSYGLVVTSYAAPVTERRVAAAVARGCPYRRDDAVWGRTVLFPRLSAALRDVADRTGARFLDLVRATEGHEACARPRSAEEWQRRLTVDPHALVHGGLDAIGHHLAQESFHPTAAAHAELGRCVREFVRSGATGGSCVLGADGHLHPDRAARAP